MSGMTKNNFFETEQKRTEKIPFFKQNIIPLLFNQKRNHDFSSNRREGKNNIYLTRPKVKNRIILNRPKKKTT